MANAHFIPFSHSPSNVYHLVKGGTLSHTVTAGYYARVVFSLQATTTVTGELLHTTSNTVTIPVSEDSQTKSAEFWVKAGTAIVISADADHAPGQVTTSTGSGANVGHSQVAYGNISGNTVVRVEARGNLILPAVTGLTWTYEEWAISFASAWIEEYPIQT